MGKLKVYCAHPITGLEWAEVIEYYANIQQRLKEIGFNVLHPMTGKSALHTEVKNKKFQATGNQSPVATDHAIFERDRWMVRNCDILYLDLSHTDKVSIGCMMELAWASMLDKYTVVVLPKGNLHRHAFVLEAADIILEDCDAAIDYLTKFAKQEI